RSEHLRQRMPHYPASMQDHVARTADEMDAVANQALPDAPDVTEPVLGGLFRRELYKQVPDSKRYGYMRGLWVRKEIYDDIVGSISPQYSDAVLNQVASAARKANSLYKGFKTAWSIPA